MLDLYEQRLKECHIEQYDNVAVYGTGEGADIILKCLDRMMLKDKLKFIVDKDDSVQIKKLYKGHQVTTINEIAGEIDAVIIGAKIHHKAIWERLIKFRGENGFTFSLLNVFGERVSEIHIDDYIKYVTYIEERNYHRNKDFIPIVKTPYHRSEFDSRIIAWYLPQYYKMEVNDFYHGKGFTEWTLSSQANPLFVGHNQPHIPYDVGYYDLSLNEVLERQAELAALYGIYGFCFDYYWFSGERIMEKPIEMFYKNKKIDLHYCFNWCTENWTALWDGEKNNLIFEQKLLAGDDESFMQDIMPYFKDERYIKIDGKPLLMIYNCTIFEKKRFKLLMSNFREIVKQDGFPDIYIMLANFGGFDEDVSEWGSDALIEYPAVALSSCPVSYPVGYLNTYFIGKIRQMGKWIEEKGYLKEYHNATVYRSALTNFDNSARKAFDRNCEILQDASADYYNKWLKDIMLENKKKKRKAEDFVFVLAWNEWAEAAHLEPDVRYGYANLQATRDALEEIRPLNTRYVQCCIQEKKEKGIEKVCFVIHCIESLGDIIACEPVVRYLKELDEKAEIIWLIRKDYKEAIRYNPYIDVIMEVKNLSESIEVCKEYREKENYIVIDLHQNGRQCVDTGKIHDNPVNAVIKESTYCNYGCLLENFCLSAGLPPVNIPPRFYENASVDVSVELPAEYIVFHCRSAEKCKDWQDDSWRELARRLIWKGIKIVEVGKESVIGYQEKNYTDATNIRDIQEIAQIIKRARFFVGIDSAFAHMANCFDIFGIILLGKYKNFTHPLPYSGKYGDGTGARLLYSMGNVKELSVDVVYAEAIKAYEREI